jgi:hypothetical protein
MPLKTGNSRRVAKSRLVCMGLKGSFTRAISAAILGAIFSFWWMRRIQVIESHNNIIKYSAPSHPPKGENRT